MGIRVAVAGASGYAGGELLRLLAGHPEFDLVARHRAHARPARRSAAVHPQLDRPRPDPRRDRPGRPGRRRPGLPGPAARRSRRRSPPQLPTGGQGSSTSAPTTGCPTRRPGRRYYGGEHAGTWTYGLPELPGQRAAIAAADRVANTGCYAVATILALAPLIAAGRGRRRRGGGRRLRHLRRRPGSRSRTCWAAR